MVSAKREPTKREPTKAHVKSEGAKRSALGVKVEALRVKKEGPGVKHEPKVKQELPSVKSEAVKAKLEEQQRLRGVKLEGVKREAGTGVKELLQRGLALRAKAEEAKKIKQEAPLRKVKKEHKKKTRRKGGKRRVTAARRNASREVMNRPVALSEELADVVGAGALSRPETVKRLWAYCRENDLLNPSNKRQILCNESLRGLLGKDSAYMTELQGLLMPHFDYSTPVDEVAQGIKGATVKQKKEELHSKRELQASMKAEQKLKAELKEEAVKAEEKLKEELKVEQKVKRLKEEARPLKSEIIVGTAEDAEAIARDLTLCIVGLSRESVAVEFAAPAGQLNFEAVAVPAGSSQAAVRVPCRVELRENAEGGFEACGEAQLEGLRPESGYLVSIAVASPLAASRMWSSREVSVPQRAHPGRWCVREVQLWCSALRVPELARKVAEYAVDGATLLSFGEDDLRGLGLSAPFLLRRVLSGLKALGGG